MNRNEFQETLVIFRNYVGIDSYVDYDQWMKLPEESKAAGLYICFYPEISLAWYKAKQAYPFHHDECDGVSTVMQYLQKNVPIIENDPKRYTCKYIYRVAFNCLDCVTYGTERRRFEHAMVQSCDFSWNANGDTVELNLFDLFVDENPVEAAVVDAKFTDEVYNDLWNRIDELDSEVGKHHLVNRVVNTLIDGKEWTSPTYPEELIFSILQRILMIYFDVCIMNWKLDDSCSKTIISNSQLHESLIIM